MQINLKIFALIYTITNDKLEFLLLKNNNAPDEKLAGKYYVVTGSVEKDESLEDALKREVYEETGITEIVSIKYVDKVFEYYSENDKVLNKEYVFSVEANTKKIRLSEEHTEYKWVSGNEFIDGIYWEDDKSELISWVEDIKNKFINKTSMNNSNQLLTKLKSLNLLADDFAIFGSGAMYPRGLKELNHDIDVIARGKAWKKALTLAKPEVSWEDSGALGISLFDGQIEISNGWGPGKWNIDELIDTADIFGGVRYVSLENTLKWKKEMSRPKDLEHIKNNRRILKKFYS